MQRVREQEQSVNQSLILGGQDGGLPPSVGMSAKKSSPRRLLPQKFDCATQSLTISGRIGGKRRPVRPLLAEGHIAAEDREPGIGESASQRGQQSRPAVCAGSVCEHQTVTLPMRRNMEEASYRRLAGHIRDLPDGGRSMHRPIVGPAAMPRGDSPAKTAPLWLEARQTS
jgi:hypothetical protein